MPTLCEPETKLTKEEQLTLLETKYPEKSTMQRTIKPLWNNYYRINYFHAPTETFPHSHFVEIQENGAIKNYDQTRRTTHQTETTSTRQHHF